MVNHSRLGTQQLYVLQNAEGYFATPAMFACVSKGQPHFSAKVGKAYAFTEAQRFPVLCKLTELRMAHLTVREIQVEQKITLKPTKD